MQQKSLPYLNTVVGGEEGGGRRDCCSGGSGRREGRENAEGVMIFVVGRQISARVNVKTELNRCKYHQWVVG